MEQEMEFLSAPQQNLQTWSHVVKLITFGCIGIALLLAILAATLL